MPCSSVCWSAIARFSPNNVRKATHTQDLHAVSPLVHVDQLSVECLSCIEAVGYDEETEKEIDSHIRHLNSTERHALEDGIAKTAEEIDQILDEAKSLGCEVKDKDLGDTDPLDEEAPPSDVCKPILAELEEAKMKLLVLKAVKTLDDDICFSELTESREERKKRSIETQATLSLIDEQLERGAKLLGKVKSEVKIPRKRRKNYDRLTTKKQRYVICYSSSVGSSLQDKANEACGSVGRFTSALSDRAINAGHTIQVSLGGDIGLLVSMSLEVALTYGQHGEFGCAASLCTGFKTNIGVGVGITEGYYFKFSDVPGDSEVSIFTVGAWIFSYSYGLVHSSDGRLIGRISSVGVGVSLLPVDVAYYFCDTRLAEPCSSKTLYAWC